MDRKHSSVNRILEEAAYICGGCKEAAGDLEPTEGYKRRQVKELKQFATTNNLWLDFPNSTITYMAKGGENEVFFNGTTSVIKLNNFDYAGDDLTNFFIRIEAHNLFFSNIPYEMIGFTYNSQQEFCAVLVQPYVRASREATEDEIATYMKALGFTMDYADEFHNKEYEIFDAVPNNVLYGIDNKLYFIDTQIRLKTNAPLMPIIS
mgnify:FL=1